jgi:hypothetical protein
MENKSRRGGKREGAGRPSKAEEMHLIERLDKHIDNDEAILLLKKKMDEGDFKALQLYMNYYYGKPKETKDVTINAEQPLFDL